MRWRAVRRFLRRRGLWPKASRSAVARAVRPWSITELGPDIYLVEYERRDYSVAALMSGLDLNSRRRLRKAIDDRRRVRNQYEAWLMERERPSYVPGKLTRLH